MYIQTLVRDIDIESAIRRCVRESQIRGYRTLFVQAEIQTNMFSPKTDVFVTLEVEKDDKS